MDKHDIIALIAAAIYRPLDRHSYDADAMREAIGQAEILFQTVEQNVPIIAKMGPLAEAVLARSRRTSSAPREEQN